MSSFWIGNVCLLISMVSGAASQIVLKALFNQTGPLILSLPFLQSLCTYGRILYVLTALGLLAAAFVSWMMTLSRLNISYAYPLACSSALLVALLGVVFLGEAVSVRMWGGTVLIILGTILLGPAR